MWPLFLCLLQLQFILWLKVLPSFSYEVQLPIAKPDCKDRCGQVRIPYPFGIGPNCYHDTWYEISCTNKSKAFLRKFNLEVMDIDWWGRYSPGDPRSESTKIKVNTPTINMCTDDGGDAVTRTRQFQSVDLGGSPYSFLGANNVFRVDNCGVSVVLKNRTGEILGGCASYCAGTGSAVITNNSSTDCYGVGCCQFYLPDSIFSLDFYEIVLQFDDPTPTNSNACTLAAAFIDTDSVDKVAGKLSSFRAFSTALFWNATYVLANNPDHPTASCYMDGCTCAIFYEGNPYLPNGCQVVHGCQKCPTHCSTNFTEDSYYCDSKSLLSKLSSILGFSIGMGLILLALSCYGLYRFVKRRNKIKQKAKCFKRNGGLLLQQQMSSSGGTVEKTKLFMISELKNATDNFNENRVLGQGGQGTVYKGMLMDGTIVAIKRSKKVDESQVEQFINEVVILSQVNHRNVVNLIGCCLETEVPLLVYEFIPNGTLYQHINDPGEDFHLTWKKRLEIAADSAGGLAYLHSSSAAPIYHRDIKSSNILVDEKYRAKVSDFGTSKAITIEQTHVTTCIQGTYGYLDPEYFQSNQFTEKSDVYSFGVVLVELITGRKPVFPTEAGGWKSLAIEFLWHMENSRLFDMLDTRVLEEGTKEELIAVANLARRCLNMKGKQRPTMNQVAMLLDGLRSPPVSNSNEPTGVLTEMTDMQASSSSINTLFFDSHSSSFLPR